MGEKKVKLRELLATSDEAKKVLAEIAKWGSGSACRSFLGPWVVWRPDAGVEVAHYGQQAWVDFILLLEEDSKQVSSSEAHVRVKSSPRWPGRVGRALERLAVVKEALRNDQISVLKRIVLEEALDMHELFHTAQPSFRYWNQQSEHWIAEAGKLPATKSAAEELECDLPSFYSVATLDAGANVHWFVPAEEKSAWEKYFLAKQVKFITARAGMGAKYTDENFRIQY